MKTEQYYTIKVEMNDGFESLNKTEANPNQDFIHHPLLIGFNTNKKPKPRC